ncbi:MAG: L-threonine 3-dehydrogenase [Deltaproteobacteria bacterium]|nr:L-threonine 3-dehydrogenase [Deltaproteobacteria bacterium]
MRAICKSTAAAGIELIDTCVPKPGERHVVVKVKATSICGTDLHIYQWDPWAANRIKPPLIFGHEFAGEIVEVGKNVRGVKVGDHISCETHIPCEKCYQCQHGQMHLCQHVKIVGIDRPGCFAEYVDIPDICCVVNNPALPWNIASIQEPFGNAVYCVSEGNVAGKTVAVFGDGPIGIFTVALARAYDAKKIIACGMQPYRLDLMRKYHPDVVVDVRSQDPRVMILEATCGMGVDVVFEISGSHRAIHDGLAVVRSGGTFIAFGVPSRPVEIDVAKELIFKGVTLKAIFGRRMFETWDELRRVIDSGKVNLAPIITHEFPLTDFEKAMQLLTSDDVCAGKIVLKP